MAWYFAFYALSWAFSSSKRLIVCKNLSKVYALVVVGCVGDLEGADRGGDGI